ncbi:hypothetical protein M0812_20127 [Anaeramoeba flamelloides]|uniref:LisH domain-containing protein n=1 Tax=Anaeramoeba flamelloides TaxID=1746091 RepID=A0AAV7YWF1_9EUKA|nr:hypothetical protein M0812_20127 [Anaeramoeba flamelloides]
MNKSIEKQLQESLYQTLQKNGELNPILSDIQRSIYETVLSQQGSTQKQTKLNSDLIQILLNFLDEKGLKNTASILRKESQVVEDKTTFKQTKNNQTFLENIYSDYLGGSQSDEEKKM